jgi:hypothetical protein
MHRKPLTHIHKKSNILRLSNGKGHMNKLNYFIENKKIPGFF